MKKKVLGKGLGALLEDFETEEENIIKEIKTINIEPNKAQPRKHFDDEKLKVLAESIKTHGIIQPIIVKRQETGFYKIIAGERRWRAAKIAGLTNIPVIIKEYGKSQVLEVALIENLQREDLNPIEEAKAYQNLIDEFKLTQEEISQRIGKSRSSIANSLRLLRLPEEISLMLIGGDISNGHARAILSLTNPSMQKRLALKIVKENLNVRQAEKLAKHLMNIDKIEKDKKRKEDPIYIDIQNRLSQSLGTKVKIQQGKNKGKIEIEYYSQGDLERLLDILNI